MPKYNIIDLYYRDTNTVFNKNINMNGAMRASGTDGVDVLLIGNLDLSQFTLQKTNKQNTFFLYPTIDTRNEPLKDKTSMGIRWKHLLENFDPAVDMIRTSDGDFTLQEIFDYGNNAPFYKQAKINLEVQQQAQKKAAPKR